MNPMEPMIIIKGIISMYGESCRAPVRSIRTIIPTIPPPIT
jgi:hypothetical protein